MDKDIVARIGGKVESVDDLIKYSRAVRMLQPPKESGKFWHSESFYKFLGGAIGSVVAAVALVASGFISFTSTMIESSVSGLDLAEKNRAAVQEKLKSLEEQYDFLTEKNVLLERRDRALAQANADAAEDLAKAKGDVRSISQKYSDMEAELSALETEIAAAKDLASKERIAGSAVALCDIAVISTWYRKVSIARNADPAIFNPRGLGLTLYFVQDGELFFVFRQLGNGRSSQVRTGGGIWRVTDDSLNLIALENGAMLFRVSFDRTAFESFSELRVNPQQPNRPTLKDVDGNLYFSSRCPARQ